MPDTQRLPKPKIVVLYNESPDWPGVDKAWTARMVNRLSAALHEEGYEYQPVKFFDTLSGLDHYDPRRWLIWNWAEEIGGRPWTDAVVAAELGQRGFAYTGSRPEVLALSVRRLEVKARLRALGLPTLPARLFTDPAQAPEWDVFPAIVKGANQHGSFSIDQGAIVYNSEQLARRIALLRRSFADDALIEPFLDTREFHITVLGNGHPEVLPPVEYDYSAFPDMHDRLYMYRWKYDESSEGYRQIKLVSPPVVADPRWLARLEEIALEAYRGFGLTDYGRIDTRMLGDEPQVLDINPNPDLDIESAVMVSAKARGLGYNWVVRRIIELAAERMPK